MNSNLAHLIYDGKIENISEQSYFQFISDNLVVHIRYDKIPKFLHHQIELGYSKQDIACVVAHDYVGYVFPSMDGLDFSLNLLQYEEAS